MINPKTIKYGSLEDQSGDLYLPSAPRPPVICLLHGGFWRMPYGRDQMSAVAQDLAARGFAVWNLEYRRTSASKSGWPGTFDDVVSGIEYLSTIVGNRLDLNLNLNLNPSTPPSTPPSTSSGHRLGASLDLDIGHVTVVGHSAGGHLALLSAACSRTRKVRITAVVGQVPITDLTRAGELGVGGSAIAELLGGSPAEQPVRYREASPNAMLPIGVQQLILHGTADDVVPIDLTRSYVESARSAGDSVDYIELAQTGHMDYIDPSSTAHSVLCDWLSSKDRSRSRLRSR